MRRSPFSSSDIRSLRQCELPCREDINDSKVDAESASHSAASHGRSPDISNKEKMGGLLQVRVARQSVLKVQATSRIMCSRCRKSCQSSEGLCRQPINCNFLMAEISAGSRSVIAACCMAKSPAKCVSRAYMSRAAWQSWMASGRSMPDGR